MRIRNVALSLIGLAVALACPQTEIRADVTVTLPSQSIPLTTTNWGPGSFSPGVDPLVFSQFNPSLGTLESVNFTLSGSFQHNLSTTFTTPSTNTVSAENNSINLTRPDDSAIVSTTVPNYSQSLTYGFNPGETLPHTVTFPTNSVNAPTQSATLTSAADLALFTGTGTIALPVSASATSVFLSSSGNGSGLAQTLAGATVAVSYTYFTPAQQTVPEPSSVALLGLGGGMLLVARSTRRRRARR